MSKSFYTCSMCNRSDFKTPQAVGAHKRWEHGGSAGEAASAAPPNEAPRAEGTSNSAKSMVEAGHWFMMGVAYSDAFGLDDARDFADQFFGLPVKPEEGGEDG